MLDPVGPLPAAVYWRRRLVAVAATTTVVILLAWALGSAVSRPGAQIPDRAAVSAPQATATSATGTALGPDAATPDGSAPAAQPGEATANGTAPGGIAPGVPAPEGIAPSGPVPGEPTPRGTTPGGATPGAAVPDGETPVPASEGTIDTTTDGVPSSTSERVYPDDTPRAPVPVPPAEPLPPTGPVQCTNEMLQVGAEVAEAEHRVGQRPTFRLVIVNVSAQPCVRDLDGVRQEIVVWSADLVHRLWSSNDCVNPDTDDLRTLVPGQPVAFSVRWAGRTTTPGCREERTTVPPGDYQIMTRIDDLVSAPTPFRRLP